MRPPVVEEYLARLDVPRPSEPDADALRLLHRAHVQRFAHDTVWISRGRLPELTRPAMTRALLDGEGGGCLQLNIGFGWLLEQLGFAVTMHRARVQRAFDPAPAPRTDAHVVLDVRLGSQSWLADVGLGSGLLDPTPLQEGDLEQSGGFRYALRPSPEPGFAWQFHHDRRLFLLRMLEWEERAAQVEDLADGYVEDTTSPDSPFLRHVTASRRLEDGVVALTGRVLVRRGAQGRSMSTLGSAEEWEHVLREDFRLALPGWTPEERDRIWTRLEAG